MNITIFGASGRTGLLLMDKALQQGHQVTAFVRQASRVTVRHPRLQVVEGSLENIDHLRRALTGRQAVISALGVARTLQHDPDVIEGIRNIVQAMSKEAVPRFIYQSVFLAHSRPGEFSFFARNILRRIIRKEVEDHEVKENLVQEGVQNYTIVRPVRLTNELFSGKFHHGVTITSGEWMPSISRTDTAHFMLQQLEDKTYLNKAVRLMKTITATN